MTFSLGKPLVQRFIWLKGNFGQWNKLFLCRSEVCFKSLGDTKGSYIARLINPLEKGPIVKSWTVF